MAQRVGDAWGSPHQLHLPTEAERRRQWRGCIDDQLPCGVQVSASGPLWPVSWPAMQEGVCSYAPGRRPLASYAHYSKCPCRCQVCLQLQAASPEPNMAMQHSAQAAELFLACSSLLLLAGCSTSPCCTILRVLDTLNNLGRYAQVAALSTQLLPFALPFVVFCALALLAHAAAHRPSNTPLLTSSSARRVFMTKHGHYVFSWQLSSSLQSLLQCGTRSSGSHACMTRHGRDRGMLLILALFLACVGPSGASAPVVFELQPTLGPSAGGTMLTVTGNNLVGQDVFCKFGGDSLVAPITLSTTQIVCDTPSSAASRVFVEVTTDGGLTYSHDRVAYLYSGLEVVTGISPSKGPDFGSTVVRVSGRGFQNVASLSCMFGVTLVSAKWLSSEAVECMSPPKNAGLEVSVRVANNGVDFSTTYGVFLVTGASIDPDTCVLVASQAAVC